MPIEYRNKSTIEKEATAQDLDWSQPASGPVVQSAAASPASASLQPSQFVFWIDATPNAVILHVKIKDSAGTVVEKAVVLS